MTIKFPALYRATQKNVLFNMKIYASNVIFAAFCGGTCLFYEVMAYGSGEAASVTESVRAAIWVNVIILLYVCLRTHTFTLPLVAMLIFSLLIVILAIMALRVTGSKNIAYFFGLIVFDYRVFFVLVLIVTTIVVTVVSYKMYHLNYCPTDLQILIERETLMENIPVTKKVNIEKAKPIKNLTLSTVFEENDLEYTE